MGTLNELANRIEEIRSEVMEIEAKLNEETFNESRKAKKAYESASIKEYSKSIERAIKLQDIAEQLSEADLRLLSAKRLITSKTLQKRGKA